MKSIRQLVRAALDEDIGQEDVTTNRTVPPNVRCQAELIAKQDGVLSGIEVFRMTFDSLHANIEDWDSRLDGDHFEKGDTIATFTGNTRAILTGERTALNFIQHLSGVATITNQFVERIRDLGVRVCDTRKTTPMMRRLEKKAVMDGGGMNHRHSLFNGVVIKENHIMAAGGIKEAVRAACDGTHHLMKIEVEVTSLDEFEQALEAGADVIMLDNMTIDDMTKAVQRAKSHRVVIEASGNVTMERIRPMAETGVNVISIGALTHSAPSVDLSLLISNA